MRIAKSALAIIMVFACLSTVIGQESEHKRAADAWVKKDYDAFITHAENFILLYPHHDFVANLEYRLAKARAFQGKYKEAMELLYQVSKKHLYSVSGLMAREDAQLIESAYTSQPETLAAFLKADELKMHVSGELTRADHEKIKKALEDAAAVKGAHGTLASKIEYEQYVAEERELKREYTAYYPDIKPDLLIGFWETFEAGHADDEFGFKGFISRVKLYGWLAEPFGHSQKFKARLGFFDRGIELARDRLKTEKEQERRWLLMYRLAKLLKAKQFSLVTINSDSSFRVLKDAMDTYDTLLKEAPNWYLIMDVISDIVDLKCLVAQYDDAYTFAYEQAKNYTGQMEYGKVFWTLFKYMSLSKSKYLLKKSLKVFQTLAQVYGPTTFYSKGMEHYRKVKPEMEHMGVFIDEVLGTRKPSAAADKTHVEVPEDVRRQQKEMPTFMTSIGKFLVIGLVVLVALTVLLVVADRLRQKEELERIEKEYEEDSDL